MQKKKQEREKERKKKMRERKKKHMAKEIILRGDKKDVQVFSIQVHKTLWDLLFRHNQTSALKQKSCRARSGSALLPVKGMVVPHGLCSDTEGELPDLR